MLKRGVARAWLVIFLVASVLDLIAEAFELRDLSNAMLWVLMPSLGGLLISARGSVSRQTRMTRIVAVTLVALFFSWLGDNFGNGDLVIKLGFFMIAQIAYIVAFWPYRRASVLRRPLPMIGYAAVIVALVAAVSAQSGSLLVPVILYGASLGLMAVLATGLGLWGVLGGLIFLVSDTILALNSFVPQLEIPLAGFWIMASYLLAQGLLIRGVLTVP